MLDRIRKKKVVKLIEKPSAVARKGEKPSQRATEEANADSKDIELIRKDHDETTFRQE